MIPISYNRRVTITRRGNNVANDGGYGPAGEYATHLTSVPAQIVESAQNKADIYDGIRFPAFGSANFPPQYDIKPDDRIVDGSRTYEIFRASMVYATINIPHFIRAEWREVQQ